MRTFSIAAVPMSVSVSKTSADSAPASAITSCSAAETSLCTDESSRAFDSSCIAVSKRSVPAPRLCQRRFSRSISAIFNPRRSAATQRAELLSVRQSSAPSASQRDASANSGRFVRQIIGISDHRSRAIEKTRGSSASTPDASAKIRPVCGSSIACANSTAVAACVTRKFIPFWSRSSRTRATAAISGVK